MRTANMLFGNVRLPIVKDAPANGKTYGRKDREWVEVTGGSGTDEKVKYDAADPTAGYLSEKIVAGANITIEEGTGADENKVKISSTGGGSTTYLGLTDTSDTTYTDKDKHVPMVNEATGNLDLTATEISAVIHVGTTPPADTTKLWYDTN